MKTITVSWIEPIFICESSVLMFIILYNVLYTIGVEYSRRNVHCRVLMRRNEKLCPEQWKFEVQEGERPHQDDFN